MESHSKRNARWIYLVILTVLWGCNAESSSNAAHVVPPAPSDSDSSGTHEAALPPSKIERPRLDPAYIATRQAAVARDPRYAFATIDPSFESLASDSPRVVHRATNVAKSMRTELLSDGAVHLRQVGPDESPLELKLVRWGSDDRTRAAPAISDYQSSGNRIELLRGPITEWYVNGPLGVEQGFTISQAPEKTAARLVLELETKGARPVLDDSQRTVRFIRGESESVGGYSDLFVKDATGKELTSSFAVSQGTIRIAVDIKNAQFPIVVDPLAWLAILLISNSTGTGFGDAVATDGIQAIVGAPDDNEKGLSAGAVFIYERSGNPWIEAGEKWIQTQKMFASDATTNSRFGSSLALSGDTLLISNGGEVDALVRVGSQWVEQQMLVPPEGAGLFGSSLALDGDTALVPGVRPMDGGGVYVVFVYTRTGTSWSLQQELTSSDYYWPYGIVVALDGDTALVGAGELDQPTKNVGAVYVFVRSGESWSQQQKLVSPEPQYNSYFGIGVGVIGDTAFVGNPGLGVVGSVYVFSRSDGSWTKQDELMPDDRTFLAFGKSVATDSTHVLVGADGAAYLFGHTGNEWLEEAQLRPTPNGSDSFGNALAVSENALVIGNQGTFVFPSTPASPCKSEQDCASGNCVDGICCDTACTGSCQSCWQFRKADGSPDGTCGIVHEGDLCGTVPDDLCTSRTEYASERTCDAAGACKIRSLTCDGGFSCINGVCATDCRNGGDPAAPPNSQRCAETDWCDTDGTCKLDKPSGAACTTGAQCTSDECIGGFCANLQGEPCPDNRCKTGLSCQDGYCCDSDCTGICEACNVAGHAGECTLVAAGNLPHHGTCLAVDAECGDGTCDGTSTDTCTFSSKAACGATSCSDGTVSGEWCHPSGQCVAGTNSCGLYACADASVCGLTCTSHDQCAAGAHCDQTSNTCVAALNSGASCTDNIECASTHCVDGFCCNTACDQQCEACDGTGTEGTCTAVDGAPHGARVACDGSDPTCGSRCDGQERATCTFPGATTECGTACASGGLQEHACDGLGNCVVGTLTDCSPFVCDTTRSTCATSCTTTTDCVSGATCEASNQCAFHGTCLDENSVKLVSNEVRSCAPYICRADACLAQCQTNDDCTTGSECTGTSCSEITSGGSGGNGGTSPSVGGAAGHDTGVGGNAANLNSGIGESAGSDNGLGTGATNQDTQNRRSGGGCSVAHEPTTSFGALGLKLVAVLGLLRRRQRTRVTVKAQCASASAWGP